MSLELLHCNSRHKAGTLYSVFKEHRAVGQSAPCDPCGSVGIIALRNWTARADARNIAGPGRAAKNGLFLGGAVAIIPSVRSDPRPWLPLAPLLLLAALVHGATLRFDFVGYDDPQRVLENPFVRQGLTIAGLRWAFTTTAHAPYWHPLTWLSHMADAQLFGLRPAGHHATNVLLHLASVVSLFGLLRCATGQRGPSLAASALFALHPVQAGTVAWVSARPDLLCGLFSLIALWAYVARARAPAFAALAAALLSKPTAAVVPLVMVLLDTWPLGDRRDPWTRLREKTPWLLLAAAGTAAVFFDVERVGGVTDSLRVPFLARAANAAVSYVRYLGHAAFPVGLSVHYPHPALPGGTPWSAAEIASSLAGLVLATALAVGARRLAFLRTGWLWFLLALVPVIGLVQIGDQALADRYLYFPGIGLWIAAAWTAHRVLAAVSPAWRTWLVAVGVPSILALLAWGSFTAAADWRDSRRLFSRALERYPDDPVMHYDLGVTLEEAGETRAAADHYRRAVEVRPTDARAHNNLGHLLAIAGREAEALAHFRRAVALEPGFAIAWNNLGNTLRATGRDGEALAAYRRAISIEPSPPEAMLNLAAALESLGRTDDAITQYRGYLASRPAEARAWQDLGVLLLRAGRAGSALDPLGTAVDLTHGRDPRMLYLLGEACFRVGDIERARQAVEQALAIDPLDPGVADSLAGLRDRLGPPGPASRSRP